MTTTHTDGSTETSRRAGIALTRADTFLAAAEQELPGLAADLRGELRAMRMGSLANLLTGLDSIAHLLIELRRMGLPAVADEEIVRLEASLRQLVTRQEAGDWPGAADALDAQLAPLIPAWRAALARRAEMLKSDAEESGSS